MDELRILIARLGWPSTTVRWWTMQELAARLGEPDLRADTELALLQLLRSRKLEAEAVEILCIFWLSAKAFGYSPVTRLAESIPKPSILSDLLMESLGVWSEACNENLEEVPVAFEIPEDFEGVQGSDLPRIFRTSLRLLEKRTGFPFVRQMAFEWTSNRTAYPDAPFQGDPWHFARPLGDGFVSHISSRIAVRAISAYLRTLAVAEQFWGMPQDVAESESLLALPIHPTLGFLRPQRPTWFPRETDFDGDTKMIQASLQALLVRVQLERPGDELIAFSSPVTMSTERCVEISMVRWSQAVGSNIADDDLAEHLDAFWSRGPMVPSETLEPLSTTTLLNPPSLDQLMKEECKAWPLAAPLDLDRLGYLQHDLYPSRLYLPMLLGSDAAKVMPHNGQLEIKIDGLDVADLCYWNAGWGVTQPKQFGGNCGTALTSRGTAYREKTDLTSESVRSFYLWQVKTLHRSNTYDQLSQTLKVGTMFV